ncbi:hypothetical protein PsorP6_008212 [Peronosclerospora sorghi]|uniref:Uncharacterized protein n=1 Tax=Peronosclerospora sorghi TaxID=230839 RepID=A0ACC0W774_9STRA|nr:hypothetical protein PsorP6_008212 [Peronosclerospora sorghi]
MDACLQRFDTSMGSTSAPVTSSLLVDTLTPRRIPPWDNKRDMCNNCEQVYLKTLSQHSGFCSVDCKSNMMYLEKVNCSIRAMKEAVNERQRLVNQQHMVESTVHQEPQHVEVYQQHTRQVKKASIKVEVDESSASRSLKYAQSFAQFNIESRAMDSNNLEWAFSALY